MTHAVYSYPHVISGNVCFWAVVEVVRIPLFYLTWTDGGEAPAARVLVIPEVPSLLQRLSAPSNYEPRILGILAGGLRNGPMAFVVYKISRPSP